MLHQFTFKNFKSFREETTLDLLATSIKEHENEVVTDIMDEKVLKIAAIYGANASGKSNVIAAFTCMRHLVRFSFRDNDRMRSIIPEPNWFEAKNVPTEFSVLFSTENAIYQYGFAVLDGTILEEYLYQRDGSQKKEKYHQLIVRDKNGFAGELLKELGENNVLDLVDEETLFLSVLSKLRVESVKDVYSWFKKVIIADYGHPDREKFDYYKMRTGSTFSNYPLIPLIENDKEKQHLEKFIKAIDVGISGIGILKEQVTNNDTFMDDFKESKRVVTYHRDGKTGKFLATPLESESSGTLKMLMLYVDIKRIMDNGGTVFIDEMDAKLHPLLLRYILIMFHDRNLNPNHAQLIFSTQEVFTLDKENLRRDEVWFVDKNELGESELYSLVSYVDNDKKKVRNDASYGKDYILGKYKSIPRLKRMEDIYD